VTTRPVKGSAFGLIADSTAEATTFQHFNVLLLHRGDTQRDAADPESGQAAD
jgi:hypothetical protein